MNEPNCTSPLYVRMDPGLKYRINRQSKRLNIGLAALAKMALTKFVEEEEQIEANNAFRRTK